jgi:hypothetical protein
MGHTPHMGFQLELDALKIADALVILKPEYREVVISHLAPKKLQGAVKDLIEVQERRLRV